MNKMLKKINKNITVKIISAISLFCVLSFTPKAWSDKIPKDSKVISADEMMRKQRQASIQEEVEKTLGKSEGTTAMTANQAYWLHYINSMIGVPTFKTSSGKKTPGKGNSSSEFSMLPIKDSELKPFIFLPPVENFNEPFIFAPAPSDATSTNSEGVQIIDPSSIEIAKLIYTQVGPLPTTFENPNETLLGGFVLSATLLVAKYAPIISEVAAAASSAPAALVGMLVPRKLFENELLQGKPSCSIDENDSSFCTIDSSEFEIVFSDNNTLFIRNDVGDVYECKLKDKAILCLLDSNLG